MRDVLKLSITLALICAVAGASLAATYSVTSKIIEERKQEELQRSLGELLPDADHFEVVEEEDVTYYMASRGGQAIGAVMVSSGRGYAGLVNILVSVDMNGNVQAVKVSNHRETAGIGDKVETPDFLGQFVGKNPDASIAIGQDISAVSGATVTSRAVAAGVRNALLDYQVYILGQAAPTEDFNLAKVKDGVYSGTSTEGYKDRVDVEVTVESGKITSVKVTYVNDTPQVAEDAVREIPKRIVDKQHWQVDAVSGATVTSEAIMDAVRDAIPDTTLRIENIEDGVYDGEGIGYGGSIKVSVEISDGKIVRIQVTDHKETDYVSDPAFEKIPKAIMDGQTVEVDTISSATRTSEGIIEAVTNALESAPRK